jgi:aspartate racemase
MKTIGIVGGITWLSTIDYYRMINQAINEKFGGVSSAKIILWSVEFAEIKKLTVEDRWDEIAAIICHAAQKLEQAGADCILIGANTMHKIADRVQASVTIPLLNIAEVTAEAVVYQNIKKVALLGTKYTMQLDFYRNKLAAKGIETIIPANSADIEFINDAIYEEMGKGLFLPETKAGFIQIINQLTSLGAEGIILGCTEIPILIKQADSPVPVFDTTAIHVKAAVDFAVNMVNGER